MDIVLPVEDMGSMDIVEDMDKVAAVVENLEIPMPF